MVVVSAVARDRDWMWLIDQRNERTERDGMPVLAVGRNGNRDRRDRVEVELNSAATTPQGLTTLVTLLEYFLTFANELEPG